MDLLSPLAHVEAFGLDAAATLAFVGSARRRQDEAAAEELRGVCQYADLHRVPVGWGAVDPALYEGGGELGSEGVLRMAGQGASTIAEFALTELAAALGLSEPAMRAYAGQALELRDRLPRCWDAVMAGVLPSWKARRIAEQTIPLSAAGADFVDAHLAPFAHQISPVRIDRAVAAALLRFDPELAQERAAAASDRRGVWCEDNVDGTTSINALASTPDARAFDAAVSEVAVALGALGDVAPLEVRRSKALGVLADPQFSLDLLSGHESPSGSGTSGSVQLHVHVHYTEGASEASPFGPVARVDAVGPRSTEAVRRWVEDLAPGALVRVTPVADLTTSVRVDAYEVPARLAAQVAERDLCCQFPWCGRQGRYDRDHITPYVAMDDGGPPGQTETAAVARLCRFHHRVKTHSEWTYHRTATGELCWTSPLGRTYVVTGSGTLPRDTAL